MRHVVRVGGTSQVLGGATTADRTVVLDVTGGTHYVGNPIKSSSLKREISCFRFADF